MAKLPNGSEALTVFNLAAAASRGRLVGQLNVLSPADNDLQAIDRLFPGLEKHGRIYLYGDKPLYFDVDEIANKNDVQLIRRSGYQRDLAILQRRLNSTVNRRLDRERTAIMNGLPQSAVAVARMGPLAGAPEAWLQFRNAIQAATPAAANQLATKDEFFKELREGERDLLIVVAHSNGAYIYLNDERVSLAELSSLPKRLRHSSRSRLAVIVSCNAGEPITNSWWRKLLRRDYAPLAHILLEKQYVDQVIAPDHAIQKEESLEVFRRAISGSRTQSIVKGWINWAVLRRGRRGMSS